MFETDIRGVTIPLVTFGPSKLWDEITGRALNSWRQLRRGWPGGLFVVGIAVAWAVAVLGQRLSDQIRYAGTALEVFGILLVAVGLRDVRAKYGRPSTLHEIAAWGRELLTTVRKRRPVILEAKAIAIGISTGAATLISKPAAGSTVEHRVQVLEQELDRLRADTDTRFGRIRSDVNGAVKLVEAEKRNREDHDALTLRRLEDLAVGGLHLEVVGLWWLMLGAIGANIPDELIALCQWWLRL